MKTKITFNREAVIFPESHECVTVLGSQDLSCIIVRPSESDSYEVDSDFETVVLELESGINHTGMVGSITRDVLAAVNFHLENA